MPSPKDYRLVVSAGTGYDAAAHVPVRVNSSEPLFLHGPAADVWLNVRIKNYRGDGPSSSAYFDTPLHAANDDTYGIGMWFVPATEKGISGGDLQWGNDFDAPIRDQLPPGFSAALRIVKWMVDPGIDGDPYADRPYLYGPAVSSMNRVHVSLGDKKETKPPVREFGLWFDEGGDEAGRAWRSEIGCPGTAGEDPDVVGKARMKWALGTKEAASAWEWRAGAGYGLDFYNGYLDFDALALRLPGFHMPLLRFWNGRQDLRYTLRNKATGEVYLVVVFKLELVGEETEEKKEETKKETESETTDKTTATTKTTEDDIHEDDVD